MTDLIHCRNCIEWYSDETMQTWKGNCRKHPSEEDKYSQDAEPNDECKKANLGKGDFVDRLAKFQGVK